MGAELRIDGLCAGYGRVDVLRDVTLRVDAGEMVTLIGSNGAGKSTLLKAVAGLLRPAAGTVTLGGVPITGMAPERIVRQRLALVPEGRMLFGPLTVDENLLIGAHSRPARDAGVAADLERVRMLFPMLAERGAQISATLSGGEQQMLAVGRALMSGPEVLLLDEPSLGLAPRVIAAIFEALDTLRSEGLSILLVEQDAHLALRHADRGYVMRNGAIALEGPADKLRDDEQVRHAYLGGRPETRE
ncbi:MAG: ABC transporter ATP-binding protein [Coriobacteriia bacterium]|nr:ABC transporter ATP-binding protein [Coriobacteriia bacterium]MBN2841340.1 ABC transporter ATP-binding protein [Coriobacteriia bacterium]